MKIFCHIGKHSYTNQYNKELKLRNSLMRVEGDNYVMDRYYTKDVHYKCSYCSKTKVTEEWYIKTEVVCKIPSEHYNYESFQMGWYESMVCKTHLQPFVEFDHYFPYYMDNCKCKECII